MWTPTHSASGRALSRPVTQRPQFWTGSHVCNQRAFSFANVAATKASAPVGVKGGAGDDENFDEVGAHRLTFRTNQCIYWVCCTAGILVEP